MMISRTSMIFGLVYVVFRGFEVDFDLKRVFSVPGIEVRETIGD